jgi:hypothetical protein
VFWALPVHATARLAVGDPAWLGSPYLAPALRDIDGDGGRFDFLAKWVPRALGLICYFAAIGAAVYAWIDLPIEPETALARRVRNEIVADIAGLAIFAALYLTYVLFRRYVYSRCKGRRAAASAPCIGAADEDGLMGRRFDALAAGAVFAALLVILAVPPVLDLFPRLWLVPLLLGVWTPLLGLLARKSYAWRLPLGLAAFAAMAAMVYRFGDNHDSELIAHAPAARPSFTEAAARWKAQNCNGADCPSPILVLITGGASRSAFFADSALGLLTDATCPALGDAPGACAVEPLFARRLFAISSVSGGSVGAAVYARALVDGRDKGAYAPPCKPGRPSSLYFKDSETHDWRGCLQKILAEDYLSPVVAGLGFRDVFDFLGRDYWPDRGRRLEQAIACAYFRYVGENGARCRARPQWGLDAPLSRFAGEADWTPLLLINSTSSESGKRFVFSGLAPAEPDGGRWLQDAYDFHETLPGYDISLIAAAHDSARFPVVSPAGAVRGADGEIATKLVDGGYFDNYGASTLFDLALALKGVGLDPFVILIANDPTLQENAGWATGRGDGRPELAPVQTSLVPPLAAAPIGATLATREARGEGALTELQRLLASAGASPGSSPRGCLAGSASGEAAPCFAFVSVRKPEIGPKSAGRSVQNRIEGVSMSWWLSKPLQKYLDDQLELPRATGLGEAAQRVLAVKGQNLNIDALGRVCDVLADAGATARCRGKLAALAHEAD